MAAGGAPKADEPAPHPPKDQLLNVSYYIRSPPPWLEYNLSPQFILEKLQHNAAQSKLVVGQVRLMPLFP